MFPGRYVETEFGKVTAVQQGSRFRLKHWVTGKRNGAKPTLYESTQAERFGPYNDAASALEDAEDFAAHVNAKRAALAASRHAATRSAPPEQGAFLSGSITCVA